MMRGSMIAQASPPRSTTLVGDRDIVGVNDAQQRLTEPLPLVLRQRAETDLAERQRREHGDAKTHIRELIRLRDRRRLVDRRPAVVTDRRGRRLGDHRV
jgi:hypothetical protein